MGRGALAGHIPCGCRELDTTEQLSTEHKVIKKKTLMLEVLGIGQVSGGGLWTQFLPSSLTTWRMTYGET